MQIVSALFVIGWNMFWTSAIMLFIKYVLRVPLRMSDAACKIGDYAVHREESYTFAYFNRNLVPRRDGVVAGDLEHGVHGIIMGRPLPEDPKHLGHPQRSSDEDNVDPLTKPGVPGETKGEQSKKEA